MKTLTISIVMAVSILLVGCGKKSTSKSANGNTAAARRVCIGNLREIDAGENEWALESHKNKGDVPTKQDLLPYVRSWPVCPSGGTYTINAVGTPPTCSIPGHAIPTNK